MGKIFDAITPATTYGSSLAVVEKIDRGDALMFIDYTKGVETSIEMKFEHSNKFDIPNSEVWFQEAKPDNVNTIQLIEYKLTATGKYVFLVPGYRGQDKVRVNLKRTGGVAGVAEVTEVTMVNNGAFFDVIGAAKSWEFHDANNARHYVWYRVTDGANFPQTDPGGGGTGHMVDLLAADTPTNIATKTAAILDPLAEVSATALAAVVTITNAAQGLATDAVDVDAGVTFLVTAQGTASLGVVTTYIQE